MYILKLGLVHGRRLINVNCCYYYPCFQRFQELKNFDCRNPIIYPFPPVFCPLVVILNMSSLILYEILFIAYKPTLFP